MIGLMKICFLKGLQVLCSTLSEEQYVTHVYIL